MWDDWLTQVNSRLQQTLFCFFLFVLRCFPFSLDNPVAFNLKALANKDILLRTHCCRHKCFPVCPRGQNLLRTQILCPGNKNVSDLVQKHFVSATNFSQFAPPKKHHGQQCVRNNVSSFTRVLTVAVVFVFVILLTTFLDSRDCVERKERKVLHLDIYRYKPQVQKRLISVTTLSETSEILECKGIKKNRLSKLQNRVFM